jgi:hypothetical protein
LAGDPVIAGADDACDRRADVVCHRGAPEGGDRRDPRCELGVVPQGATAEVGCDYLVPASLTRLRASLTAAR